MLFAIVLRLVDSSLTLRQGYGYEVQIKENDDFSIYGLHVNANWTRALVCNIAGEDNFTAIMTAYE